MSGSNLRTVILSDTPSMLRGRLVTPEMPVWRAKGPVRASDLLGRLHHTGRHGQLPATIATSASATGAATVNSTR